MQEGCSAAVVTRGRQVNAELPFLTTATSIPHVTGGDRLVKSGRMVLWLPEKLMQTRHLTLGS